MSFTIIADAKLNDKMFSVASVIVYGVWTGERYPRMLANDNMPFIRGAEGRSFMKHSGRYPI